ncbi:hypothetical protein UG55_104011 [Frankia sp. EI5c]|uniref:hypothetical protein n=1 Tax=Frankia sp. EI5c TaxID=683316 RepID=UPI0007C3CCA4|nr:hypothetical protein [Frankia sp. EI5c]OAA23145.1 hypothetical protein UG55_104011 [Frankia sp. EI5c]
MPRLPSRRVRPARRTPAALSGLLLLCLVVTGCSSSGSGDDPEATPAPAGSADSADSAGPAPGGASGAATAAPGTPAVSRTTRIQGAGGDVEVGFVELRVDGRLVQLDLLFTPRYAADPGKEISLYEMAGRRDAAVSLVDTANLLRYTVVKDSDGAALGAAAGTTRTRNNVAVPASFAFAAPPPEVTAVDVYLNDRLIVDDAPITR